MALLTPSQLFSSICDNRKLLFSISAGILLIATVTVVSVSISHNESHYDRTKMSPPHSLIKSSCSSTLYPDLCLSTLSAATTTAAAVKEPRDVVELALNLTITAVKHNYFAVKKLIAAKQSYTAREKVALHDCLELIGETLKELFDTKRELNRYPSFNKSVSEHADDLKIFLSATMTNQETCLDGFSHDRSDKKLRAKLMERQMHIFKLCSNTLAMTKNMTDTDIATQRYSTSSTGRRLEEEEDKSDGVKWPEWLSAGDRRLLQSSTVNPDVTVAADGSGNYRTVSEAVAAAPERSTTRYIIRIKAGVYRENVDVGSRKTNIMFMGDGRTTTIITASRNVVDGSTTFNSATVAAVGDGFLARDITFQNTAGPAKQQAVAIRVGSDLSAFFRCDMLAYQDTLYVHSLRQFYISCYIAGTVDFIFGNAAAVIQDCDIHARRPGAGQRNMVTAQGRDDPNQNTGIVIQRCRIGATSDLMPVISSFPTYLGRPWRMYSRTVIMQTEISNVIQPAGWFPWDGDFALSTLEYREYQNTGPGAPTANRVTWAGFRVITSATEAQQFTARNFIAGANWIRATGFPYSLDL